MSETPSPLEQRAAVRSALHNVRETRHAPMDWEMREAPNGTGGSDLVFTGMACVTEAPYQMEDLVGEFTETVRAGAFAKTLRENADVSFLLNHQGMTLARTKSGTMTLSERTGSDISGLHVEARLDPANPQVMAIRSAIDRGDLDSLSFAFRVTRQSWDEDFTQRDITEVNLNYGDASLVNYPANPATAGTAAIRSLDYVLDELAAGRELPDETFERLAQMVDLMQVRRRQFSVDELREVFDVPADESEPASTLASPRSLAEVRLLVTRNREQEPKRRKAS